MEKAIQAYLPVTRLRRTLTLPKNWSIRLSEGYLTVMSLSHNGLRVWYRLKLWCSLNRRSPAGRCGELIFP